jgi:hypothetical protein
VPYQLHAWTAGQVEEIADEDEGIEEIELTTEERSDEDDGREEGIALDEGRLEDARLEDTGAVPQIEPVIPGTSIAPPLAFTCTPKATFCPGWILPFQLRFVAI